MSGKEFYDSLCVSFEIIDCRSAGYETAKIHRYLVFCALFPSVLVNLNRSTSQP